jgi:hypothetical protein
VTSQALQPQLIPEACKAARPPTGRAVLHPRLRVDQVHRLDLRDVRRAGLFKHAPETPRFSQWRWGWEGEVWSEVAFARLKRDDGATAIAVTHPRDRDGSWQSPVAYLAWVTWTRCHFGGVRPWFVCPAERGGVPCGRRCRVLYRPFGASVFACRLCFGLTYESRQAHRNQFYEGLTRPFAAQNALRRALDPRCSPRRQYRASERAWKAMPGLLKLAGLL